MSIIKNFDRKQKITIGVALLATVLAGALTYSHVEPVIVFVVAGIALASLAATVGDATDELGDHLNPGATGVVQSAIGNLPELFVSIFALKAGLITVVQASIIGSILSNGLLVLGAAFFFGGLKNGSLKFKSSPPRMIATLMLLAVSALVIPTMTYELHLPASGHEDSLSLIVAIVLLLVFVVSIPFSIRGGPQKTAVDARIEAHHGGWPLSLTIGVLAAAGLGAAFVSEWFVHALEPAIETLGISEAFAGLVIVALAGNAVENVVGIELAVANKIDLAVSVVLNSALQVALLVTPILVLASFFLGGAIFTLVMPPMMVAVVFLAALLSAVIVFDGRANWLEGVALLGLYAIIAASFWWG